MTTDDFGHRALIAARRIQASISARPEQSLQRFRWSEFFEHIDGRTESLPRQRTIEIDEAEEPPPARLRRALAVALAGLLPVAALAVWLLMPPVREEWASRSQVVSDGLMHLRKIGISQAMAVEEPSRLALFPPDASPNEPPEFVPETATLAKPSGQPPQSPATTGSSPPTPDERTASPRMADAVTASPKVHRAGERVERRKVRPAATRTAQSERTTSKPTETRPSDTSVSQQNTEHPLVSLLFPLAPLFMPPHPPAAAFSP